MIKEFADLPLTKEQQKLVTDNIKLAYWFATKFTKTIIHFKYGIFASKRQFNQLKEEYVSAAIEGICIAAQRWDPSRGVKFSTYAHWYMRKTTGEEEMYSSIYLGPKSRHTKFFKQRKYCIPFSEMDKNANNRFRDTLEFDVWDYHYEQEEVDPNAWVELSCLISLVLDKRQLNIVTRHAIEYHTLQEIGDDLGISKERVRQIYSKSIQKLKDSTAFTNALEKRMKRRREQISNNDFFDSMIGMPTAAMSL